MFLLPYHKHSQRDHEVYLSPYVNTKKYYKEYYYLHISKNNLFINSASIESITAYVNSSTYSLIKDLGIQKYRGIPYDIT